MPTQGTQPADASPRLASAVRRRAARVLGDPPPGVRVRRLRGCRGGICALVVTAALALAPPLAWSQPGERDRPAEPRPTLNPAAAPLPPSPPLLTTDLPDAHKRPRRVALLPLKSALVRASELLAPGVPRATHVASLEARVLRALRQHPYTQVLSPADVRRRLAADHGLAAAARAAQARYRLGLEYYMGLSPARAIQSLQEAARLFEDVFRDVSAPKALADAWFMLGVSMVDAGNAVQGHVALKRGFAVQPGRRFRPRFFPQRVEQALHAALADHLSTGNHARPYGDAERLTRLANRLRVDALVTVTLRRARDGAPQVVVSTFQGKPQRFDSEVALPLEASATQLEPALSRWLACLPVQARSGAAPPRRDAPMFMDTAAAYALYLRQPTRRPFHSVGFAAGFAQQLRPGLEWYARVHMFTSLSDPYRDLLHAFNSVRFLAGVGFALQRGPLRFWVRPGVDVHALGRFIATTDPDCKLYGESHHLCNQSTVRNLEQDVLVGFHLAVGTQVALGRRFFVLLRLSGSAYVFPLSNTDDLNFPAGAELGLGYRF